MDRLSDHRFVANYFRLYLHAAALNLLVRLRREVAAPNIEHLGGTKRIPTQLGIESRTFRAD